MAASDISNIVPPWRWQWPAISMQLSSGLGWEGSQQQRFTRVPGRRVLVLERNEALGGAAIIYRHGSLAIEASLHEIDGLDQDDPEGAALTLARPRPRSSVLSPSMNLRRCAGRRSVPPAVLPHGIDAALSATSARFPASGGILAALF